MKLIYFVLFLLLPAFPGLLFSQSYSRNDRAVAVNENPSENTERLSPGRLNINQDERLNELLRRHVRINERTEGMPGYRIRIFSESGQNARPNANNIRAKFFNKYPEIETYLQWDAPNFKVYVGDFRTRSEALKTFRKIERDYPYSFIVSDRINFPPLD
jgi:hypothetical protein